MVIGEQCVCVCIHSQAVYFIYIPQLIFQCGVSLPAWLCSCFLTDLCKKPLKALFYSFTTEHPFATNKVMKFNTTWWSQPDLCLLNTDIICSQFHKEILLKTFCSLSLFFFLQPEKCAWISVFVWSISDIQWLPMQMLKMFNLNCWGTPKLPPSPSLTDSN